MWPATRQARCAEDVGAFLAELQAALTIEDAGALGCGAPVFPYPPSELASRGIEAGKTAMMRW